MAITVRQALNIGGLQKGRLLAGSKHLDRIINHVNILEAPWEPFWETQDHLFLTSFYALRDNTSLQIKSIQGLAEQGCAALVFQKGIQDILDPLVVQQAEESGLPLIEVEESVAYPEIITPLVQAISREKTYLLQRSQEIHQRLTGLILGGDGLQAVADALHELINRPVAFVNGWGDLLAGAPQVNSDNLLQEILQFARPGLVWNKASGCWLVPLVTGKQNEIDGFVLVWDAEQSANQLDLTAIEQAATVASLELAKQRAVLETERRLKRDFLEDMLTGEHHSVEALLARGRSLGWDLQHKRVVMLVDLNEFEAYYLRHLEKGEAHFQHIKQRFLRGVSRVVAGENPLSIVVERSDSIVVMPHFAAEIPLTQAQRATHALAERICAGLPETLNELSVSVAIGNFYDEVVRLRHSFEEATAALEIRLHLGNPEAIIWYEDVALYVLLKRFSDQSEVNRWREQILGRLIIYDQNNDTELIKTLETYFDANQNSQQAARDLFVHPKTLKYRLRRIEEILGINPFKGDRQLAFYLATKLTHLHKS
ncbi:PucR family transcriptional regulator [Candidatus Leptofilum sp.]|uniref:PucR family transcriptional regulator n=1 Tax=Candidatus Leptofilum sp. TaxID=3241576 RepID=UPI003B59A693